MLYGAVKIMMTIACRFFYRRMYVTGVETIPAAGPAIIIANHTSSLMDAALLGILVERPIHFFTRGDIFKGKFASKILDSLNMIPVHNHETDRASHSINNESFLKASRILAKGGIVVFFPEGTSHTDRKLRSFRKGAFRLAFQSATSDGFKKNIVIIPAGINYSHPSAYQADVMVHFGSPILLNDYFGEFTSNSAAALLLITKDSFSAIEKQALNMQDETRLAVAESCLQIRRNNYNFHTDQWMQSTRKSLEEEKAVCSNILRLTVEEVTSLEESTHDYFKSLSCYSLNDKTLSPAFYFSSSSRFLLLAGLPLFLPGYILNCLPIIISKKIADTKVYREDFYSWIFVTGAAFLYIAWLMMLLTGFLFLGWVYSLVIVTFTIVSGIFVHRYLQWKIDFIQAWKLSKMTRKDPILIKKLFHLRQTICKSMQMP